ncbi:MAG: hypothetical protein ACFCUT_02370 [Kiloniellaceae bacterium]
MTVRRTETGTWAVVDGGEVLAEFPTNAAAWRWLDIHMGDSTNRKEASHAWSVAEWLRRE